MKFIGGQIGKFNKSTMLGGFSSFPHGFELSRRVTSMIKMNLEWGIGEVMIIGDFIHLSFHIGSQPTMRHIA